jgi:hypothetical protein
VRQRRLVGASGRPLHFTVRCAKCAFGRFTPNTSTPKVWSHSGGKACSHVQYSEAGRRDTAIILNSSVFALMHHRVLQSTLILERWRLREKSAGIRSIDGRSVRDAEASRSVQRKDS